MQCKTWLESCGHHVRGSIINAFLVDSLSSYNILTKLNRSSVDRLLYPELKGSKFLDWVRTVSSEWIQS